MQTNSPKVTCSAPTIPYLGMDNSYWQGSSYGSLDFKSAAPAMLTGGVFTIALTARLLCLPVQVQQGCS